MTIRTLSDRLVRPLTVTAAAVWLAACSTVAPPTDQAPAQAPAPVSSPQQDPSLGYKPLPPVVRNAETPALDEIARANMRKRDLWDRIRDGFAMPELDTPLVAQKEAFYLERPDYLQRMFDRGSRYLHHIVEELEKRNMPTELALLPFVESAMVPTAMSSAKAAGLWQFIPSTGKQYDLSQNWWVDNRRDVVQSTRAALDYLQYIHELNDNDWFLALASYNWGEGAVGRAVKRNKSLGKPAGYLDLNMPNETRNYVPKLIALKNIILRSRELGVNLPDLPDRPYFVTVEKSRPIDLKLAADFAQMSIADFVALNPAHNRPVVTATSNNVLKIPADRIDHFMAAMQRHEKAEKVFASWQPYTLKNGETLADVAKRGNVSAEEILRANSIAAGTRVLPGTHILAPQKLVEDERRVEEFKGARVYQLVNVPPNYHRAQRRETAQTIARRYGVSVADLRAMNGNVDKVRPGSSLMVRRASTQTVLVTENGERRVVARQQPEIIRTSAADADPTPTATSGGITRAVLRTERPEPVQAPARSTPSKAVAAKSTSRAASTRATPSRAVATKAVASRSTASNRGSATRPASTAPRKTAVSTSKPATTTKPVVRPVTKSTNSASPTRSASAAGRAS